MSNRLAAVHSKGAFLSLNYLLHACAAVRAIELCLTVKGLRLQIQAHNAKVKRLETELDGGCGCGREIRIAYMPACLPAALKRRQAEAEQQEVEARLAALEVAKKQARQPDPLPEVVLKVRPLQAMVQPVWPPLPEMEALCLSCRTRAVVSGTSHDESI